MPSGTEQLQWLSGSKQNGNQALLIEYISLTGLLLALRIVTCQNVQRMLMYVHCRLYCKICCVYVCIHTFLAISLLGVLT